MNRACVRTRHIGTIFSNCPPHLAMTPVIDYIAYCKKQQSALAVLLNADNSEKLQFLACVYDEMYLDETLTAAFNSIIMRDRVLDVMDYKSDESRKMLMFAYYGAREGIKYATVTRSQD